MIPIEHSQEAREACDKIGEAVAVLTFKLTEKIRKLEIENGELKQWRDGKNGIEDYYIVREKLHSAKAKIEKALEGIDKTESESHVGWWETFDGAKFGKGKLEEIKSILE